MRYFKTILLFFFLLLLPFFVVIPSYAADPSWSELQPLGNVNGNWKSVATSPNGQIILLGQSNGRLMLSRDSGATWRDQFPENSDEYWNSVAVSPDGQKLAAAGYRVYVSTNGGTTWTDTQPNGNTSEVWGGMGMSNDGRILIAGSTTGRLFRSTNGGASWSETRPAGNVDGNWQSAAISITGDTMIVANYNGRMYRSRDRGATWSEIQPSGDMDSGWNVVRMDGNGKIIIAGQDGGMVFISTDYGANWYEVQALGDTENDWRGSSISMDGSKIMISSSIGTSSSGRVFYSGNSGQSFQEVQPAGNVDLDWFGVGVSPDGHNQFALATGGRVYRRIFPYGSSPELVKDREPWDCGVEKPLNTDLFQIDTTRDTATLYFSPISNTSDFVVSFSTNPSAEEHGAQVNLAREGVQNYTINMLQQNTTYYFKVRGQHGCRAGEWSEVLEARTTSGISQNKFFLFK